MRVLIDLGHPAHVHFFRHAASRLARDGHTVCFTGRQKDILVQLAKRYGLDVDVFGVCRPGVLNRTMEMLQRQRRLLKIIRRFKPDAILAIAGTFVAMPAWLIGVPVYIFYDTEHATVSNLLAYPFATCVFVPNCYRKPIRWTHRRYDAYHELAYLHPKYFTPDETVLDEVGLKRGERFALVRYVGWDAIHDIGRTGLTRQNRVRAVRRLAELGRVFVSCEGPCPAELEMYRLPLDVGRVHDLLAHAALMFGESATMASEGAVLGVPGVFVDPVGRGYTDEQERKYGLVSHFTPEHQDDAIAKACGIVRNGRRDEWKAGRRRLIDEKIDVTELICQVALERPFARWSCPPICEPLANDNLSPTCSSG